MIKTIHIVARPSSDKEEGFKILVLDLDHRWLAASDDIVLGEVDVQFDIPGATDRQTLAMKAVKTLQEKQERVIAEAVKEKADLQAKINKLLALPWLNGDQETTYHSASMVEDSDDYEIPF